MKLTLLNETCGIGSAQSSAVKKKVIVLVTEVPSSEQGMRAG